GARGSEMTMSERLVGVGLVFDFFDAPYRLHCRRRMDVIQQRGSAGKAFVPHQLLGVDAAGGLSESCMPLARGLAESVVDGHCCYKLPLSACSCSIASNSALKLPFPKLRAPFRSITS